jgi:P4 family phage/plasmid primase-like protien
MSEDEHVDMNDSPFPQFWDKKEESEEKTKEEIAKIKEKEGFGDVYTRGTFFDKNNKFQPYFMSSVLQKQNRIVTIRDNGDIYIYDSDTGVYIKGEQTIKEKIAKILGVDYLDYYAEQAIDDLKVRTGMNRQDFNPPLQYVNVLNGVIDISDLPVKKLLPHDPKYFFIWKLPHIYDANATCPNFLRALEQMLPDETSRMQIQEMFGWCLQRDYHLQTAFILFGDGNNGKDKLLTVLQKLLGEGNYYNATLQALCEDKFMVAQLYQKMANIMAELPKGKIKDSSMFKSLTGGSSIPAQNKFGQPFNFVNFAKLIFGTNELPDSPDKTFAYYRRWVLIFFRIRFGTPGHPMDKHLLDKIATPEEMQGVLNWALEGLERLQINDEFTGRMTVEETKKYYEQLTSPISAFIAENIIETTEPTDFLPKDYLMTEIEKYCDEKNLMKPNSPHELTSIIKRSFNKNNVYLVQRTVDKPRTYVWLHLRFADTDRQKRYEEWFYDVSTKCEKIVLPTHDEKPIAD